MLSYALLGRAFVYIALASIVATIAALAAGAYSIRKKKIIFPTAILFLLDAFYVPARWLLKTFSMDEDLVDQIIIEISNSAMRDASSSSTGKKIVVFPQCLRHPECKATCDPKAGYKCKKCGRCVLGELSRAAEDRGILPFIVPGDRFVKTIIKNVKPSAALGVACRTELSSSMRSVSKIIPCQGVALLRDGCYMTQVDPAKVVEKMDSMVGR